MMSRLIRVVCLPVAAAGAGLLSLQAEAAVFTTHFSVPKSFGVVADGVLFKDSPLLELPVTEIRLYWGLDVAEGFNAADVEAYAGVPIFAGENPVPSFNLSSTHLGWSGSGTFNHTDTVDLPNMAFGPAWTFYSFSALAPDFGDGFTVHPDSRIEVDFIVDIPGDTDNDGDIDDADIGTMIANFTGPVGQAGNKGYDQGDTDNDRDVDDADIGTVIGNFTGPIAVNAVPEPASLPLLALGVFALRRRG